MFPFVEVPELSTAIAPVYPGMSTIALTLLRQGGERDRDTAAGELGEHSLEVFE